MSPARRRLLQVLALLAGLAVVAGVLVAVHGRASAPRSAVAQDRLGPVLLVPGYGGNTAGLRVLAARLEAEGRDAVVVELPGDGTGDLEDSALRLRAAADRALAGGA
ncbi:MAG: estB, partial [Frankiales bacterium]|nr:estB [Frankiales bacterium]